MHSSGLQKSLVQPNKDTWKCSQHKINTKSTCSIVIIIIVTNVTNIYNAQKSDRMTEKYDSQGMNLTGIVQHSHDAYNKLTE